MLQRQKDFLFLFLALIGFFTNGCQEVEREKGELIGKGDLEFKVNELDRKTIYDGRRIQLIGYISPKWRQQGNEIALFLSETPDGEDYKKQLAIIKVFEGAFPNRVVLGKTGNVEKVNSRVVKGSDLERVEFDPEKMLIYDNAGTAHKISEKIAVSGTVKYGKKVETGEFAQYESSPGILNYTWSFTDIRIDPATN